MSTLIIWDRFRFDTSTVALRLADALHTEVTAELDERRGMTFTADVSRERMADAAFSWMPFPGIWGVTA